MRPLLLGVLGAAALLAQGRELRALREVGDGVVRAQDGALLQPIDEPAPEEVVGDAVALEVEGEEEGEESGVDELAVRAQNTRLDADAVKQLCKLVQEVNDFNSSALLEARLFVIAELVGSVPIDALSTALCEIKYGFVKPILGNGVVRAQNTLVDADAVKQLCKRVQEVNYFNSTTALVEAMLKVIAELVRSLPSDALSTALCEIWDGLEKPIYEPAHEEVVGDAVALEVEGEESGVDSVVRAQDGALLQPIDEPAPEEVVGDAVALEVEGGGGGRGERRG
jgi:hypothetical protein